MVIYLPRKQGAADIVEGFGPLAEALGTIAGSKLKQVRTRNAYKALHIPEHEADAWSHLPQAQQQTLFNDYLSRRPTGSQQQEEQQPVYNQPIRSTQPLNLPRLGAAQIQNALPQRAYNQIGNPVERGQQGVQAPAHYQQALASGNPRDQLQSSDNGIKALQRAQQAGLLGYPQGQQAAQNIQRPQREPGRAPTLESTGGIAPVLPSEGPKARGQINESGIPIQYQGFGLKPYKQIKRGNYNEIVAAPTHKEEEKLKKDYYEQQLKTKENASVAEKPKVTKIYKDADEARKTLDILKQLQEVNKTNKITTSKGIRILGAQLGGTNETKQSEDLVESLPKHLRGFLSTSLTPKERQKILDQLINQRENALAKEVALNELIEENNGWTPRGIDQLVNKRAKVVKKEEPQLIQAEQHEQPKEEKNTNYLAQAAAPLVRAGEIAASGFGLGNIELPIDVENKKYAKEHNKTFFRLPTTEQAREKTRELTGETFEPTGYGTELYQDIASKALLMIPGGTGTLASRAAQSLLGSVAGVGAREALKTAGVGPAGQAIGEFLITAGASSSKFIDAVRKERSTLYDAADKIASTSKDTIKTQPLYRKVNEIYADAASRGMEGKSWLLDRLKEIEPIITKPLATPQELWNVKKDLNSWYGNIPNGVRKQFGELRNTFSDSLADYSKKNPSFGIPFNKAEALSIGLGDAEKVRETIEKSKLLSNLASIWGLGGIIRTGRTIASPTGELSSLLLHSPQARQIYAKVYKNALAGNIASTANSMRQMNKILERQQADFV